MSFSFAHPWILVLLLLVLLPWLFRDKPVQSYTWVSLIPADPLSDLASLAIRLLLSLVLGFLVIAMAGPYLREQYVDRVGNGAHVVLLFDRSASMNDNFATRYMGGKNSESKAAVARDLLLDFVAQRQSDLFAMVSFSTAPIYMLPLTQDREAIRAAILSTRGRGRGITNIAPALGMALGFYDDQPHTGSRVVILISDGAARMEPEVQQALQSWFQRNQVNLYWIYLRTMSSASLFDRPDNPNESTTPEYFLHQFFSNMGVPYQAFEAESPTAVADAVATIGQLENHPIRYQIKIPRENMTQLFINLAMLALLPLILARYLENRPWKT